MAKDKAWLRDSLAKELGWDASVAEDVVEALAAAQTPAARNEIIEGYLGGGAKVKSLVATFFGPSKSKKASNITAPSGRELERARRQAGSVTVRHVAGRPSAAAPDPSKPLIEREVCNCLSCGKIYFTRSDSEDVRSFLNAGGVCTFCGARVSLTSSGKSETHAQARADTGSAASSSGQRQDSETLRQQDQEAKAFKDRLVEYDRNARKRTTVVDDQNDFFEIDANAWLSPEEREALKLQELAMQEAEEARKRRVTVTLDLMGRQVISADATQPTAEALQFAAASQAAAQATSRELPQGGGTATASALQTAARIRPNVSATSERPLFVVTSPESVEQRQQRRGVVQSSRTLDADDEEPQGVVGGWGNEKAAKAGGSGMSAQDAKARSQNLGQSGNLNLSAPPGLSPVTNDEYNGVTKGTKPEKPEVTNRKKLKRPQLRRVQHVDPFEGFDMQALDDTRPEVETM